MYNERCSSNLSHRPSTNLLASVFIEHRAKGGERHDSGGVHQEEDRQAKAWVQQVLRSWKGRDAIHDQVETASTKNHREKRARPS